MASLQGDYEDEEAWNAVGILRRRRTVEVFELAKKHCESEDPKARARGLDVLGQLGARAPSRLVINSAAWALAHSGGERAAAALVERKRHDDRPSDKRLRLAWKVAVNPKRYQLSIELMDDPSDDARDWATFELGAQCDEDSDEIGAALRKRLTDSLADAKSEAIWDWLEERTRSA